MYMLAGDRFNEVDIRIEKDTMGYLHGVLISESQPVYIINTDDLSAEEFYLVDDSINLIYLFYFLAYNRYIFGSIVGLFRNDNASVLEIFYERFNISELVFGKYRISIKVVDGVVYFIYGIYAYRLCSAVLGKDVECYLKNAYIVKNRIRLDLVFCDEESNNYYTIDIGDISSDYVKIYRATLDKFVELKKEYVSSIIFDG